MKKKLTLLMSMMAFIAFTICAEPVKVGNLWYEIIDETAMQAEIVAPPDGTPYSGVQNGWFAKSVTINGVTYAVETVGEGAFEGASFSPYANSSGVATFYMIAVPMKVIKKDAFKDITTRSDGNVGIRFTTNVCTGNVSGASLLTAVEPGAFRGAHIRGFVATGSSGGYSHTTAFSNGATGLYNTNTNTIISAPADMRADASMGSNGSYGGYATTVTFNSAAVEVAAYAFWGNTHIKTMNMNEGLTTIGQQAFYGMTALQTVNIPSTVTTLATDAFEGCTAISNLTCNVVTPPAGVVFDDAVYERIRESGNITVPAESLAAYQADPNWGRFWNTPAAAPKMYIAGSFTNWADGKLEMTEDNGTYSITVNGIQQWAEFKFIEEDGETTTWYGGDTNGGGDKYGVHPDWCTGIALAAGDAGSNFQVTNGSGDLTFTIDADKNLTITGWAAPANELYLAGNMTNWGEGKLAMTQGEDGKFSITQAMEAGAEFKFIDQDGTWIGGDAEGNFIVQREQVVNGTELSLLLNAGNNFQIPVAGTWTLTVDKETMKLVISGEWALPKYTITVTETENGTVVADKAEAEEGETVTLTVTPAEGYQLDALTVMNGEVEVEVVDNTFTMPAGNVTVTATFAEIPPVLYTITVAETENGTVVADKAEAEEGETVTLTVTPAEGYQLDALTVMNGEVEVEVVDNTFTMPAGNVTVTATFAEIPPVTYPINVVAAENGTVVADPTAATIGQTVTLTVTPAEGYQLKTITVNAGYEIQADNGDDGGRAPRKAGGTWYNQGSITLTKVDDTHYTFVLPEELPNFLTPNYVENTEFRVNATFEEIPPVLYTITVAETENGTVVADKAEAEEGETVTLTVTPAEGYLLDALTVMNGEDEVEVVDNAFTMPAGNVTVTATFAEIPPVVSTITFEQVDNATIVVKAAGDEIVSGAEVAEGTEITIEVTPAEGYQVKSVTVTKTNVDVTPSDDPYGGEFGAPRRADSLNDAFVEVTSGENGIYSFTMPDAPVSIEVTMEEAGPLTGIADINATGNGTVKYVNPMGQVSNRPFKGVNIVVDGGKTYKVIKN